MADHALIDHTGIPGVGGSVATDTIWDAAGDLVQGTGANTAAKLSAGTAGKVLTSNGAAAALTWETPSSTSYVGALVTHSTTQSIPNNAFTALTFDTESGGQFHDTGSIHSGTTFTASSAGKWVATCSANLASLASGIGVLSCFVNGSEFNRSLTIVTGDGLSLHICTGPLNLASSDAVTFQVYQSTGSAVNIGSNPIASLYKVG